MIISGAGDDTVTGHGGVDLFVDTGGQGDTLIEARALNFSLTDEELTISGQRPSDANPALPESVNEEEAVGMFERFILYGGARPNLFTVDSFTKQARLDGTQGGDTYVLTLTGPISGRSAVSVADSGTGATDTDRVEIWGGVEADTLHLDIDTSWQQLVRHTAGSFELSYHGQTTTIVDSDGAAELAAKLEALPNITDVTVTGTGTAADPWDDLAPAPPDRRFGWMDGTPSRPVAW